MEPIGGACPYQKRYDVDVVIVGGGPTGVALAAQTKTLCPEAKIVIHEKYTEYQRKHILQLEKKSFGGFPNDPKIKATVEGFFKKEHQPSGLTSMLMKSASMILPEKANVRTSEIEGNFKKLAQPMGVEFVYEAVDFMSEIRKRYPNVKILVGADGSHSEFRKQVLSEDKFLNADELEAMLPILQEIDPSLTQEKLLAILKNEHISVNPINGFNISASVDLLKSLKEKYKWISPSELVKNILQRICHENLPNQTDLQYVAELKYEVEGKAEPVNFLLEGYPTQKALNTIVQEYVGKLKDGKTPITLRAFIEKDIFDALQNKATFKGRLDLENPLIPPKLKEIFEGWLNLREQDNIQKSTMLLSINKSRSHAENPRLRSNMIVTVIKLQSYFIERAVKEEEDGFVSCAVGDAAAGVPFFRSFNGFGLPGSSELAVDITSTLRHTTPSKKWKLPSLSQSEDPRIANIKNKAFRKYARFHLQQVGIEIQTAKTKNMALNAYKMWIAVSRIVPWQLNMLDKNFVEDFIKRGSWSEDDDSSSSDDDDSSLEDSSSSLAVS